LLDAWVEEMAEQQKCRFLAALKVQLVAAVQAGILATETLERGVLVGKVDMAADTIAVRLFLKRQVVVA
jgi:hypothetical protein